MNIFKKKQAKETKIVAPDDTCACGVMELASIAGWVKRSTSDGTYDTITMVADSNGVKLTSLDKKIAGKYEIVNYQAEGEKLRMKNFEKHLIKLGYRSSASIQ